MLSSLAKFASYSTGSARFFRSGFKYSNFSGRRQLSTSTRKAEQSNGSSYFDSKTLRGACLLALPIVTYVGLRMATNSPQMRSREDFSKPKVAKTAQESQVSSTHADFILADQLAKHQSETKGERLEEPVYRIVLTGGPCGGKSTAMAAISDRLSSLGFRVFCVPEGSTLLITGMGMVPPLLPEHEKIHFEGTLLKTKIALEDTFFSLAKASKAKSVVLCDRGTMDTAAYLDKDTFDLVLSEFGWNIVDLRDRRYDGVVHLVTAAIGALPHYHTENNTARHESPEEAAALDIKVLNAWVGHPRIRIVDNSTDWKGKVARVLDIVCQYVGAPRPSDSQRKFILTGFDEGELKKSGVRVEQFEVEQTYLERSNDPNINGYTYLRRRGQNGAYTYTISSTGSPNPNASTKTAMGEVEQQIILERAITGREYLALTRQSDSHRESVKKQVYCFVHENNYYEIHKFLSPNIDLVVLSTETARGELPSFVKAAVEVTGEDNFSSYFISKHFKESGSKDWKTDPVYAKAAKTFNTL